MFSFVHSFLRSLSVFVLLLFSTQAWSAAGQPLMSCVSEFPSTTFIIAGQGEWVDVQVIHHNGSKYVPFWDSLVVPNDIPSLKERADVIQKMGDGFQFRWKASQCKVANEMFFECIGGAEEFEVGGLKVQPWGLYVTEVTERTPKMVFSHRSVRLLMTISGKTYQVLMNYQDGECINQDIRLLW
jgi:hypothetical protein